MFLMLINIDSLSLSIDLLSFERTKCHLSEKDLLSSFPTCNTSSSNNNSSSATSSCLALTPFIYLFSVIFLWCELPS